MVRSSSEILRSQQGTRLARRLRPRPVPVAPKFARDQGPKPRLVATTARCFCETSGQVVQDAGKGRKTAQSDVC